MAKASQYREDPNLTFLQFLDGKDLKLLADVLIYTYGKQNNEKIVIDKGATSFADLANAILELGTETQWTGGLKNTLLKEKQYYENEDELYKKNWQAIGAELQLFGGDTLVNTVRGNGVLYKEIVEDVASKLDIDYHKSIEINELEEKILRNLFKRVVTLNDIDFIFETLKNSGYWGINYTETNPLKLLVKPFLGVSSPAYRVTIPAVCIVAILRHKYLDDKF